MNFAKKIISLLLVLVISISFTACFNQDLTWAAKDGDEEIPIGVYVYYLTLAIDEAAAKVPSDQELMNATIDGMKAEDYIREQTLTYLKSYVWMNRKVTELDLTLTTGEENNATEITSYMWAYYGTSFADMGISKSSFNLAYSQYNTKFKKVLDSYYGEGGDFEVSKDTLKDIFAENNYSYSYMYASLMTTDENGASLELTEEQIAELTATFEGYKKKIDTGYLSVSQAADEYAMANSLSESQYEEDVSDLSYQYYPSNFVEHLQTMAEGESAIFDSDTNMVLLQKYPIETAFDEQYEIGSKRIQMLLDLKSDEFTDYVYEKADEEVTDLNLNNAAIKSIKIRDFINDNTKMGTSSTESSAE